MRGSWIRSLVPLAGLLVMVVAASGCGDDGGATRHQPAPAEPASASPRRPPPTALASGLDPDLPEVRHNALLLDAERLEAAVEAHPQRLDLLRELIETYVGLLVFEGRSALGSNIAWLASTRLLEYTRRAGASDDAASWSAAMRGWLHFQMRQYPLAAAHADDALEVALAGLRQDEFFETSGFTVGPLTARLYRTLARPPDPTLLWPVMHVVLQRKPAAPPHQIVSYSLGRRGEGTGTRWYLHMHALNRSVVVKIFGAQEPGTRELFEIVKGHARRGLALAAKERQG